MQNLSDEEFELLILESLARSASIDLAERANVGNPVYRWGPGCKAGGWYQGLFQLKSTENEAMPHNCYWNSVVAGPDWFAKDVEGLPCPA